VIIARRVLPYGPNAAIIECRSIAEVHALCAYARSTFSAELADVVPGAATVTAIGTGPLDPEMLETLAVVHAEQIDTVPRTHTIEVTYDGQDLDWVSAYLGRTPAEVVEMHTAQIWTVAFCGFAPGFGYLVGDPSMSIDVPRLDRPRRSVPAGSVALAGPWSAIYPRASPGGWRLIGHTTAVLWSASAERPALLAPGDVVQFREVHR